MKLLKIIIGLALVILIVNVAVIISKKVKPVVPSVPSEVLPPTVQPPVEIQHWPIDPNVPNPKP